MIYQHAIGGEASQWNEWGLEFVDTQRSLVMFCTIPYVLSILQLGKFLKIKVK